MNKWNYHGLSVAEVEDRVSLGRSNKTDTSASKSKKDIIKEHTLTYFNFLNLFLAILVAGTGQFKNMTFMKRCIRIYISMLTLSFFLCSLAAIAQKQTAIFAKRDTQELKMDIYQPEAISKINPCVIFVFGGGFLTGSRDSKIYLEYFKSLSDSGYLVAAIDYRLGLKGAKRPPSLFNRKPVIHAIDMAVEDLYAATAYLVQHAGELNIDTSKIIVSGSSAGAITALTADYRKRNGYDGTMLPESFQYAGVISFAGAIYSNHGHPKYAIHPAPMLLFHGSKDKIVPFKKIALFGTGMYGSSVIIKRFKKLDYQNRFKKY